jgi:Nucleotidyltransferase of unknown function (DUF6036)
MSGDAMREPWRSFLLDVDELLPGPTELHCLGGFVVAEHYGLIRPTADIDIVEARGGSDLRSLQAIGGKGSALAIRHRVYLDIVTVAIVPEDYEQRLVDIHPGTFAQLRLKAFERHDLVLAKLARNADHDREDVKRLATGPGLDCNLLRDRYLREVRFQFGNTSSADLTLDLWVEMIAEVLG